MRDTKTKPCVGQVLLVKHYSSEVLMKVGSETDKRVRVEDLTLYRDNQGCWRFMGQGSRPAYTYLGIATDEDRKRLIRETVRSKLSVFEWRKCSDEQIEKCAAILGINLFNGE